MHTVAIGCDPNAAQAKQDLIKFLTGKGYQVTDLGSDDPIYANIAVKVASAVAKGKYDRGILICGTGVGISLAANRVKGIRACVCSEPYTARLSKMHNNSNVLAFGARVVGIEMAKMITEEWLKAEYEGGRHQRRVDLITEIENKNL